MNGQRAITRKRQNRSGSETNQSTRLGARGRFSQIDRARWQHVSWALFEGTRWGMRYSEHLLSKRGEAAAIIKAIPDRNAAAVSRACPPPTPTAAHEDAVR